MSAGSLIRVIPAEAMDAPCNGPALAGGALILACQYCASLPFSVYAKSEFWLNSPAQVLTKLGVILLMLAFAFVWTRYGSREDGWSWMRQLGPRRCWCTGCNDELIYGRWLWFWKNGLNVGQTVAAAIALILLMLGLSTAKTYRHRIGTWIADTGWWWAPRIGGRRGIEDRPMLP